MGHEEQLLLGRPRVRYGVDGGPSSIVRGSAAVGGIRSFAGTLSERRGSAERGHWLLRHRNFGTQKLPNPCVAAIDRGGRELSGSRWVRYRTALSGSGLRRFTAGRLGDDRLEIISPVSGPTAGWAVAADRTRSARRRRRSPFAAASWHRPPWRHRR